MKTRYGPISQDVLERIWEKIEVQGECWLWEGATNSKGYGMISMKGRNGGPAVVHVLLYEMEYGQTDLQIGHTHCYNRACVSPFHKTAQTQSENQLDIDNKRTGDSTTYPCGHLRIPSNTYKSSTRPNSTGYCKACHNV
jgi:hypothetical protein